MTDTQLNGRQPFVWRGLDPDDDTNRLIEAIAEKAITRLFNVNGSLVLFSDGQTVPVTRPVLHEIITKIIAGVRLVEAGGTLKLEYFSFDFQIGGDLTKGPNDRTLADITDRLLTLVAKGPSTPRRLNAQHEREARARIKTGERADSIARSYNVDVDTIRQLAR
jgi:hypothetical protein